MIPPGKTIGILGAGQLGKMTAIAAQQLGYRVHSYDAARESPGFAVSHKHKVALFDDVVAVGRFAAEVDVLTYEFENVSAGALAAAREVTAVRPGVEVLSTCQNRRREKAWLAENGFPVVPHRVLATGDDVEALAGELGYPCVLKTADFGYDGKGQRKLAGPKDARTAAAEVAKGGAWVLEAWIDFECEVSVVCARPTLGRIVCYPVIENIHVRHILDQSIAPARIAPETAAAAVSLAESITERLGVVGLLAVEMFVTREGGVLVNELAPRPHNSGHLTLEACRTSQFAQHVRAICGLPLGSPDIAGAAAMVNLLGDLWISGEPRWDLLLAEPAATLHLYGKREPRAGRKMGHFTVVDRTPDLALARAALLRQRLANPS